MSQLIVEGVGRRVAAYRKLNRWSARQLADHTDGAVSRDTIANIESGRRGDLTLRQFLAIALALRVPPAALLTDLHHPFEPSDLAFPGQAPAPLDHTAPHIAMAAWLNGQTDNDTTVAARWIARVHALLADYLGTTDTEAAHSALGRITTDRTHTDPTEDYRDTIRAELLALGVHLPAELTRNSLQ